MSNRKTNTIMKKFFYSVLAVAALIGCAKEKEAPVNVEEKVNLTVPYTIKASFETDSKVTYSSEGKFSWNEGDLINVRCTNPSGNNSWFTFTAQADGASTEFKGDVTDYFRPSDYAFFPGGAHLLQYNASTRIVRVPRVYYLDADGQTPHIESDNYTVYVSSSNPLAFLPSVGRWNSETETFAFSTAFGVLKVSMTDVPAEAAALRLYSAGGVISNYLVMGSDGELNIGASFSSQYSNPYLFYHFKADSEGKATLYIPLPVGNLTAGSKIDILDADDNTLFSKEFVKDVKIERNKIVTLASFKAKYEWTSVGTGRYYDKRYLAAVGATDSDVEVEIEVDASKPGTYRIKAPYAAYNTAVGYSTSEQVTAPNDMLLTVYRAGDKLNGATLATDGLVYFEPTYMGIIEPGRGAEWFLAHRTYFSNPGSEEDWAHSLVLKWNTDGTPAAIQLAPCYYWVGTGAYTSDSLKDDNVQILFPGETQRYEVSSSVAFVKISDDSAAQPVASVQVVLGNAYASAQVVIAADQASAVAALTNNVGVTTVTSSGTYNVNLPANAESGNYYVFAYVEAAAGMAPSLTRFIASPVFDYQAASDWTSLGVGKFCDNYIAEEIALDLDTFVDVEIQKNNTDATLYRVVDPYGALAAAKGYTAPYSVKGSQFFTFRILQVGETVGSTSVTKADQVIYEPTLTGVDAGDTYLDGSNTEADLEYEINHPSEFSNFAAEADWGRNIVAKYQADGTPANVLIGPIYYWGGGYWTGNNPIHKNNDNIQIVFPGVASSIDLNVAIVAGEELDDNPAAPVYKFSIYLGADLAGAKVVAATSEADAVAAIAADSNVTFIAASGDGEVTLPANAPSGDYQLFALTVPADGMTAIVPQLVSSSAFKYFSTNDDKGYTLADIVGTYTSAALHIAYYSGGWQWNANQTVTLVIEASDDDFLGNVKITQVSAATDKTFGFDLAADSDYPGMYGWFNTATGAISFEDVQPMNNTKFTAANNPCAFVGQRDDDGVDMFLDKPGQITHTGQMYIGAVSEGAVGGYYRIIGGYSGRDYVFTRAAAAGAPKASAKKANPSRNGIANKSKTVSEINAVGKIVKR